MHVNANIAAFMEQFPFEGLTFDESTSLGMPTFSLTRPRSPRG